MPRAPRKWFGPVLILAVNWFANFLHFTRFGLYEDDWYFIGYPFSVGVKEWMVDCLKVHLSNPEASVADRCRSFSPIRSRRWAPSPAVSPWTI